MSYTSEDSHRDLMSTIARNNAQIEQQLAPNPAQAARRAANRDQTLTSLARLLTITWIAFPTAMSAKAGSNWHALTGDRGASVERGAQALVRWARFQWMFLATFVPCFLFFFGRGADSMDPIYPHLFGIAGAVGLAWTSLMWGVIYCRMAEFSLFKRGPIQSLLTPVVRLLDGVHTWALGLAAWLPAILLGYMAFVPATPNV